MAGVNRPATLDPPRPAIEPSTIVAHVVTLDEHGALALVGLCGSKIIGVPAPATAPVCVVCLDLCGDEPPVTLS
jgi:hypothetical protein